MIARLFSSLKITDKKSKQVNHLSYKSFFEMRFDFPIFSSVLQDTSCLCYNMHISYQCSKTLSFCCNKTMSSDQINQNLGVHPLSKYLRSVFDIFLLQFMNPFRDLCINFRINPKKKGGVESDHRNFERSPLGFGHS